MLPPTGNLSDSLKKNLLEKGVQDWYLHRNKIYDSMFSVVQMYTEGDFLNLYLYLLKGYFITCSRISDAYWITYLSDKWWQKYGLKSYFKIILIHIIFQKVFTKVLSPIEIELFTRSLRILRVLKCLIVPTVLST